MTTDDHGPGAAHPHLPSPPHDRDHATGEQDGDSHAGSPPPPAVPPVLTDDEPAADAIPAEPAPDVPAGEDATSATGDLAPPTVDAQDDSHDPAPTTTSADGVTADLWAFRFDDPVMAQEALLAAMRLQRRNRIQLDDAAIVVRDDRGRTRIIQTKDISTGQGAISGSWLGLLAGMFVPGPGALVGLALGAAAGGLFAKLRDKGINDDEMKQWGEQLGNGESALFLLVEDCHQMRALHEVSRFPATILTATAAPDVIERVRERLPVDPWGP